MSIYAICVVLFCFFRCEEITALLLYYFLSQCTIITIFPLFSTLLLALRRAKNATGRQSYW